MASQDDVLRLRTDLMAVQQQAQRARADVEAVAARVDKRLREEQPAPVASLSARVDTMHTTLEGIGRRLDDLAARVEALDRRTRAAAAPRPTPPPAPSEAPAGSGTAPRATPVMPTPPGVPAPGSSAVAATPPAAAPAPPTAGARPGTGALRPDDIYQAAYIDFSKGSYPLAIAGFREFVRRFPDHQQAGAAQYWVGEAHVSLARGFANANQPEKAQESLEQAVREFRLVVANYPRSERTPTAIYKEALALIDLNLPGPAQSRLQYLVDNFPSAEETPLARERLTALKSASPATR